MFELIRCESSVDPSVSDGKDKSDSNASTGQSEREDTFGAGTCLDKTEIIQHFVSAKADRSVPFELYKRRTTVVVMRESFLNVVCGALAEYKYVGPNQRADLVLACR